MKTSTAFDINYVFIAYVPPHDKEDINFTIQSEVLKKQSPTTDYLFKIFDVSINEAKVEIVFNSDEKQNNSIRTQILSIAQKEQSAHKTVHARKLAQRLHEESDGRNGTGLFAILEGKKGSSTRIVLM